MERKGGRRIDKRGGKLRGRRRRRRKRRKGTRSGGFPPLHSRFFVFFRKREEVKGGDEGPRDGERRGAFW